MLDRTCLSHPWVNVTLAIVLCLTCLTTSGFADEPATAKKSETVSVFGEGTLTVPAAFERTQPKSRIIQHEFRAKAGDDESTARVTMMGASGGVDANIKRWKGQFAGGDEDAQKTEEMKLGDWKIHLVDLSGRYGESMGGGPFAPGKTVQRENYGMAGAILVHPKGRTFFVKMIGPNEVVKANREAFVEMIKSIEK